MIESLEDDQPANENPPHEIVLIFETISRCDLDKRDPEFELRRKFFYSTKNLLHLWANPNHDDPEEPPKIEDEKATANKVPLANFKTRADFG